jgi:predicted component of type VI protein secretion system
MKLKLIVLAGAKEGLEIPLKKDKFLIGRAKECSLRAGSEAISRRHCAIIRRETGWTVRDLGSRNGTLVNNEKITKEVPLKEGDELCVGPLKFRVAAAAEAAKESTDAAPVLKGFVPTRTDKPKRQPPVKDVADVVERTINLSDSTTEDDVSKWLLGGADDHATDMLKETRSMRDEETSTTIGRVSTSDTATVEDVSALAEAADASENGETPANPDAAEGEEEGGSGVWKFFKRGKGAKGAPPKKKPGKLPPRADQQSKDSREAAADILREMQRRR